MVLANRAAWELLVAQIPSGLCVLHRCDQPACVNPQHLFLGTQLENIKDCKTKGRTGNTRARANKAKTHCMRGHELSGKNLRTYNGYRHCVACARNNQRLSRQRRKQPQEVT